MIRTTAVALALVLPACAHTADPPAPRPHVLLSAAVRDAVTARPHLRRRADLHLPCRGAARRVPAWEDRRNGLTFVLAPAGTYTAGHENEIVPQLTDEAPRTAVVAAPFLICTTELTVGAARGVGLRRYTSEADDLPATRIDHGEALTICDLLGYDLPGEDEWEWAARGALEDGVACSPLPEPTIGPSLRAVGSGSANALGLRDALGNAWEWCRDRVELTGATGFSVRGGAHDSETWRLHPARRDVVPDGMELAPNIGFRPVIRLAAHSGE